MVPSVQKWGEKMQTMDVSNLPEWVPDEATRYLEHTLAGRSIRLLAKQAGCHPSTILRQVRRIERRREDPLVDGALSNLAAQHYGSETTTAELTGPHPLSARALAFGAALGSEEAFELEVVETLTCLSPKGAVLAVADGMDKAVVVRDMAAITEQGGEARLVVERTLAEALALRNWIACPCRGRISRYRITQEGRNALSRIVAGCENRARAQRDSAVNASRAAARLRKRRRRVRYGLAETPLHMLARRLDEKGAPFLTPDLVRAGERFREDFELAEVAEHLGERASAPIGIGHNRRGPGQAAVAAKERAAQAMSALGEGLSDIVVRCCCQLEGLEAAERQLGWSARSGKVVLRIALQQLRLHYDRQQTPDELIG